jgi:hypothetical protein
MFRAETVIQGLSPGPRERAAEFLRVRGKGLKAGHPAGPVLAGLLRAVEAGGGLDVTAAGLGEAERNQVSIWLHDAWNAAANGRDGRNPAAAGVLANAAGDWDRAAGVTGPPLWRAHVAVGRPGGVQPRDLGA